MRCLFLSFLCCSAIAFGYTTTAMADSTIIGVIVDENSQIIHQVAQIEVKLRGGEPQRRSSNADGVFELHIIGSDFIESIVFTTAGRHPGLVSNISGQTINFTLGDGRKVNEQIIDVVLLPEIGPLGFERNMQQYSVYENLHHLATVNKQPVDPTFVNQIREMPDPNGGRERDGQIRNELKDRPDLLQIITKKRAEILALYGVGQQTQSNCYCCRRGLFGRRR